ncbi:hypothetical protein AG1IA_03757 [Rhizoctonia solani AG-1 IA]|uniref:Uncharacterized protein n=1 Tax=Thanatephorus cucumeris (strain AG1-IA) TaxID=983506 RepID=L8WW51_THACA|nr:hypothetical protein AG1IA_03757 [Rhizoctonia solani AG-1 IA]
MPRGARSLTRSSLIEEIQPYRRGDYKAALGVSGHHLGHPWYEQWPHNQHHGSFGGLRSPLRLGRFISLTRITSFGVDAHLLAEG